LQEQYDLLMMRIAAALQDKDVAPHGQLCNAWEPLWIDLKDRVRFKGKFSSWRNARLPLRDARVPVCCWRCAWRPASRRRSRLQRRRCLNRCWFAAIWRPGRDAPRRRWIGPSAGPCVDARFVLDTWSGECSKAACRV
jgi:hypothetical protein